VDSEALIVNLDGLGMQDVKHVGGKNASLGEMISNLSAMGVTVPGGFATTSLAFRDFLKQNDLDKKINEALSTLDIEDVNQLMATGKQIREWVEQTPFSLEFEQQIIASYRQMAGDNEDLAVAVRSSATAEDLPEASFAGQQETYLNVSGVDNVLTAIKKVFASLYNDRAISYRVHQGFSHAEVALSAGVQKMARSDIGASGVMFSLDTESGFKDVVFITASYGLGETVVQGSVNPDEFYVAKQILENNKPSVISRNLGSKKIKMIYAEKASEEFVETVKVADADSKRFCITDSQAEELAKFAVIIEQHYQRPMDIEWALDGADNKLYILQARPETVKSHDKEHKIERYHLEGESEVLTTGRAIGQKIGAGSAKAISDPKNMDHVEEGDVLVTDMTDPDWEPVMKRAAAIITNRGGRTCHAAIIARELGVPAIVGCGDATEKIPDGHKVTVSCAEGDEGKVYTGALKYMVEETDTGHLPELPVKIMMNVGNPTRAFSFAAIPNEGVGLARLEFVINNMIGIHPHALLEFDEQEDSLKELILEKISGYKSPTDFYIQKIAESVATLGVAFAGKPVIVRMSDFKSNEYSNLIGGSRYEPNEENPMIGFRGTSRYLSDTFRDCFKMECEAIKIVRDEMGLTNIQIMIPFIRTLQEARQVIDLLAANGLKRGKNDLKTIMMCEVPSNAILAKYFLEYFDGFSIGSNDLTQLSLGLDRDSGLIAHLFDERDLAVKKFIKLAIKACKKQGKYVGICGQGPSDYPDFAKWLFKKGIDSISLNPDTVIDTWKSLGTDE